MAGKRRAERVPMFRVCRYVIEGREYADLSTNISTKGIFIKNFSPPPVGTEVILTVKLPEDWGNLPMRIIGKVAHINEDTDPHKRGMGVEFVSVVADSVPIIEYFVREVYNQDNLNQERLQRTGEDGSSFEYLVQRQKDGKS